MTVPFLPIEDRISYLYDRDYFEKGSISESVKQYLETVNFHYFLGYARNFRYLVDTGAIEARKIPENVIQLIEIDDEISTYSYSGLRKMEWALRNSITRHYFLLYDPYDSFLEADQFISFSRDYLAEDLILNILKNTLRHSEPYVVNHLQRQATDEEVVVPKQCTHSNYEHVKTLVSGLPLWAIVDGFSLGTLINFLNMCERSSVNPPLWKRVAHDFSIHHSIMESSLRSAGIIRNLVSHHQRLWMRPTTNVPRIAKSLTKYSRDLSNNAMLRPLLNLSLYQGGVGEIKEFAETVRSVASRNHIYWYGIANVDGSKGNER